MTPSPESIRARPALPASQISDAFESAPLAAAVVGPDDRIRYANAAMARLTDYPADELATLTLAALTHPEDRDEAVAGRRAVARRITPSSTAVARLIRRDGRTIWVSISASLAGDHGDGALVVQLVDVTDQRRAERELTRSNAELGSFAYLAAHELKSPLQTLLGFAALLDRAYGPQLEPHAKECVAWIADGAGRMDALIEDLLSYCSVDIDDTALEAVALEQVAGEVLTNLHLDISNAGAVVTTGPLPVVTGDHVQLGQLLQNLMANALKFMPAGRHPLVHLSADRDGDGWTVTVADNGIGVEAGAGERIFAMFERLHPRDRYRGTGIGLSICKRIVERRGGTIWVEPNPGGGSRFRFRLPDVLAPAAASPAA